MYKISQYDLELIDAMIDLESMGVGNDPALIQVSAVQFNPFTGKMGAEFDRTIDLDSALKAGLSISAGSIKFWMTHPEVTQEARDVVMKSTTNHGKSNVSDSLENVLKDFTEWCKSNNIRYVHGNGAASDNIWLRSAYTAVGQEPPFSFREDICFRSLKTMAVRTGWKNKVKFEGILHNGIDDAKHQVRVNTSILDHFGLTDFEEETYTAE